MFDLSLEWDRPARTGTAPSMHTLRARIRPNLINKGLPLHMAVALDTSSSMEEGKLDQAKAACLAIADLLRPEDRLSLAGYATELEQIFRDLPGGPAAVATAEDALKKYNHKGVTRTDLALDWIASTLSSVGEGAVRIGLLITDGHPTDAQGKNLLDVTTLVRRAEAMANHSISLCTVGLGDAQNFNAAFLLDLSNRGRGTFLYAETMAQFEEELKQRFRASQSLAADDVRLRLKPLAPGVSIQACCRIRPDYLPLDNPADKHGEAVLVGAVRVDMETDLLVSVEAPPPMIGEPPGPRDTLEVSIEAAAITSPLTGTTTILYSDSYRDAQLLNEEINADRLLWDVNVYSEELQRVENPRMTGELLHNIQDSAERLGHQEIAESASSQISELKREGKLKPSRTTGLLHRARSLTMPGREV